MLCMSVLQRGHSGDGCDLVSTLCQYDARKCDLFVLSWSRVLRVRWGSILFRVANVWWRCASCGAYRCLKTIDVYIWRVLFFMAVVVTVWGSVECLLCSGRC